MWRTVILPELFRPDEFSIFYFIFLKGFFLKSSVFIEVNVVVRNRFLILNSMFVVKSD
jgi:hypothetical protein